jgi:hypothetical protein
MPMIDQLNIGKKTHPDPPPLLMVMLANSWNLTVGPDNLVITLPDSGRSRRAAPDTKCPLAKTPQSRHSVLAEFTM